MATDTPNNSSGSPIPPQQASLTTNSNTAPSPPSSHPPLQYDDPQRFRYYLRTIDFDNGDFSTDDMFANPTPLPQPETPSIISAAGEFQRRRVQDEMLAHQTLLPQAETPSIISTAEKFQRRSQDLYPLARGTGLGKTESRPQQQQQKRVRFTTPGADDDERERVRVDSAVGESPDGETAGSRKRIKFDMPRADHGHEETQPDEK
jgi:hypothetical protein